MGWKIFPEYIGSRKVETSDGWIFKLSGGERRREGGGGREGGGENSPINLS